LLVAALSAAESGHIPMMVDIPGDKVETVTKMIKYYCPEADMHGIEPPSLPCPDN